MRKNMSLIFLVTLSLTGTQAMAGMTCNVSNIWSNQELLCSSFTIPDDSGISTELNCNGYKVTVDCDLDIRPNKLSLQIISPQGSKVSTSTKHELKLVDDSGNGAFVSCVVQ